MMDQLDLELKQEFKGTNVFVTGVAGFVGSHLTELLLKYGAHVIGLYRYKAVDNTRNIDHIMGNPDLELVKGDIKDYDRMCDLYRTYAIDYTFHLAGMSFVPPTFASPLEAYHTNFIGTANVVIASRKYGNAPLQFASTSEVYGNAETKGKLITEDTTPNPASPYAVSKLAADIMCRLHTKAYGANVVVTRAFNHEGPRRGIHFVTSVVASQIADIIRGTKSEIVIGNTRAQRDFNDVRDIIRGYMVAITRGTPGEVYNIGSGKATSIEELIFMGIDIAKRHLGRDLIIPIRIDQARIKERNIDVDCLRCDASKIRKLGWFPTISFKATLNDMVTYYLNR